MRTWQKNSAHVCCFCQKRLKRSGALNSEHLCVNLRRPQTDALRSCDSWSAGTTKSGERVLVSGDWSGVERTPPQCAALCARRALSCSVVRAARARAGRPQGRGPRGAGEARASRGRRGLDSLEFLDFDFLPPCALWSVVHIMHQLRCGVVLELSTSQPYLVLPPLDFLESGLCCTCTAGSPCGELSAEAVSTRTTRLIVPAPACGCFSWGLSEVSHALTTPRASR